MELDLCNLDLDLGCRREPTTWVAFEATTQQTYHFKPKRRKGARGRTTAAEMAALVESGGKVSRREQHLRPEQIEALRLKREPKDHSVSCLEQEDGEGNVEYKYRIKDPHPVRLQQLITQMKYRLSEGNGECFYYIGIEDNGYPKGLEPADLEASIATLHRMAAFLDACVTLLHYLPAAWGRRAALLRVACSTAQEACHTDLRIAVAGSVDAGKSTLVAVLTHGSDGRPLLDNGRGLARMNVFRHKHEMQSGRTSSICHQLLGYDRDGRVINYATPAATALTPAEITGSAAKVLTFLDLGGHEKYLKTALYGMTALLPDYGLLCVCAAAGLGRIAREHLAVAVALEVPVAVVITKVELVRQERFAAVVAEVRQLVALTLQHESGPGVQGGGVDERRVEDASPLVSTETEALASARVLCQLHADSLATATARGALRVHMPIFAVSAVTGAGLPVLHAFLNALQPAGAPTKGGAGGPLATAGSSGALMSTAPSASVGADSSCGSASSICLSAAGSPRGGDNGAADAAAAFDAALDAASSVATAFGGERTQRLGAQPTPQPPAQQQQPQQQHLYAPAVAAVTATAVTAVPAAAGAVPVTPESQAVHFQVDGTFEVEGVGSVVSGTLVSGIVRVGQQLMLGPTPAGGFARVIVRQLQRSHVQVKQVRAGQTCTIAISPAEAAEAPAPGLRAPAGAGAAAPGAANVGSGGGFGAVHDDVGLPLGSSPSATETATGNGTAMAAALATAGGKNGAPADALPPGVGAVAAATAGCRTGNGFEDALAAAQAALDLCLVSDDDAGGGGAGADDDLFAFDVGDGPASPGGPPLRPSHSPPSPSVADGSEGPTLGSSLTFLEGDGGAGNPAIRGVVGNNRVAGECVGACGDGMLPMSMSVCQLHSTTSFCVGGTVGPGLAGMGALSTSAPMRTLSTGAVAAAAGDGGGRGYSTTTASPFGGVTPSRKGSVLLEPALQPRTSWTFEAVLILLGGHWPARGLVSGRWPPDCDDDLPDPPLAAPRPQDSAAVLTSEPASEPQGSSGSSSSSGNLTPERSGSMTPRGIIGSNGMGAGGNGGGDGYGNGEGTPECSEGGAAPAAVLDPIANDSRGRTSGDTGGESDGAEVAPPAAAQPEASVAAGGGRRAAADGKAAVASGAGRRRRQRGPGGGSYVTVVHCGSVRQPAQVLMMQELFEEAPDGAADSDSALPGAGAGCPELRISASTRAAAALLHSAQPRHPSPPRTATAAAAASAGGEGILAQSQLPQAPPDQDLGCLVRVLLRWQHRPEWLRVGAKLLVRDRSDGRVAGAGFVRRVLL